MKTIFSSYSSLHIFSYCSKHLKKIKIPQIYFKKQFVYTTNFKFSNVKFSNVFYKLEKRFLLYRIKNYLPNQLLNS